jgi:ribosomal protein S27E
MPLIRTRMIKNGIRGLKKVKTIDTLKIARRLKFNSNKLDSLGNYLGVGRKMKHEGIDLWIRCMKGDPKALNKMLAYNKKDVKLLEDVYLELRQFDTSPVNIGMYYNDGKQHCPVCGSIHLQPTGNVVIAGASEYAEVECGNCGNISRTRSSTTTQAKRKLQLAKV